MGARPKHAIQSGPFLKFALPASDPSCLINSTSFNCQTELCLFILLSSLCSEMACDGGGFRSPKSKLLSLLFSSFIKLHYSLVLGMQLHALFKSLTKHLIVTLHSKTVYWCRYMEYATKGD